MEKPRAAYTILVLAPFGEMIEETSRCSAVETDVFNLDEAVKKLHTPFWVSLPKDICPNAGVNILIDDLKSFKPAHLIKKVEYLALLKNAKDWVNNELKSGRSMGEIATDFLSRWPGIPVHVTKLEKTVGQPPTSTKIDRLLDMVASSSMDTDSGKQLHDKNDLVSQIDRLLEQALSHIVSNEVFRAREAVWRGVEILLKQGKIKKSRDIDCRLVCIRPDAFGEVLNDCIQELISRPPCLTLVDLPFDSSPRSVELLEKLMLFSETLMTPTVAWVNEKIFHLNDWGELGKLPHISHFMENSTFSKFRKLRAHSSADWILLTCNRFLGREAYRSETAIQGLRLEERHSCWLSPVWAVGALIARSISEFGWPNRFTEHHHVYLSDMPIIADTKSFSCTEMRLSEDRLLQLVEAGFSPLVGPMRKDVVIMPRETNLSGRSFRFQLFLARILSFLFWCQENLSTEDLGNDIPGAIQRAFALQWQKTGHVLPDDLKIVGFSEDDQDFVPLSIEMTPPTSVFALKEKLVFNFHWHKK